MPTERSWRAPDSRLVLLSVLAISVAYVGMHLSRGWMPFDDGALAQSAERLMQGELPHRDFDDVYTGGLAWLNAGAFHLFGTSLWSMRLALLAVFVAWVPAFYYVASRFVRPISAGAVTIMAVVWSLPNYTAAMPSWYNLFLATFGAAALFRHLEDGRRRWLLAAGLVGGLSFLVKVAGLYYVAGVLLFAVFHAHAIDRGAAIGDRPRGTAYSAFVAAALALFVAALVVLVRNQLYASELAQFVVPGAALSSLLVWNEFTRPAGDSRTRFTTLARLLVPILIGIALPIALFLIPYLASGSVSAFGYGVFVLPMRRFGVAVSRVLPMTAMLACGPLVLVAVLARTVRGRAAQYTGVAVAVALAALFVVTGRNDPTYRTVWYSVQMLLPGLVVAGVIVLSKPRAADAGDPLLRSRTMVVLCIAALCNLIQFPYFVPNYFCYVAPLVALAAVALVRYLRPATALIPAAVVAFFISFAVLRMNDSTLYTIGISYQPYLRTMPLGLARGGIDVPVVHAEAYRQLIPLLRSRARGGYTWASPDCPEIYFLSGLKNPTRSLFDFFDDSTGRTSRVLAALEQHNVTVVVLNARAAFSPTLTDDLVAAIERRYPFARNVGPFHVRWRT
ncbi:MAG: glycosyltransferase family 39 protein [Gemmatimonadaceae bacterium]|nr:glycosyltransferase family 39 protein [Gemmatimonadaceae bacterium]